jgi:hypothetical protein
MRVKPQAKEEGNVVAEMVSLLNDENDEAKTQTPTSSKLFKPTNAQA